MSHVTATERGNDSYNLVNQKRSAQSPESLLTILTRISEVLNKFEAAVTQFDTETQNSQAEAGRAAAKVAGHMLDKAQKNLEKVIKQEHEQEHRSFWGKVFKVVAIVGVVVGVVAFMALGQPEIALAIGLGGAAAMSGLFQKGADVISKLLQSIGVPPQIAAITADAIILAITVVATMGYGEVADLEVGTEMVAEDAAEETATEAAGESEGLISRVQDLATELKGTISNKIGSLARAIGPKVGLTLTIAGTALSNLNVAQDLLNALPLSEKDKKKLLPILEVIQVMVAILSAVVGGSALSTAATSTTEVAEGANVLRKGIAKLQTLLQENPGFLLSAQRWINAGAGTGSGVINLLNGISELQVSQATKNMGEAYAGQLIADSASSMANSGVTHMGDVFANDIKTVSAELQVVDHLGDVMGKVAQATIA